MLNVILNTCIDFNLRPQWLTSNPKKEQKFSYYHLKNNNREKHQNLSFVNYIRHRKSPELVHPPDELIDVVFAIPSIASFYVVIPLLFKTTERGLELEGP